MDRRSPEVITNSRALVEVMGRWPSFHDADLLEAVRGDGDIEVVVHVFEMTDRVDAGGYFVLTKHHLVRLQMLGVTTCDMPMGYEGDILDSISATASAQGIVVAFESVVDPDRDWRAVCGEARIAEVTPCDPKGRPI
ncbi:MAG: hypothetical protein KDE27_05490 [Planctomycetes bacterium]|nr:hypothetical protein [Planctomycetota bacterium]